jgi:hypothetical protein
MKQVSMHLLVNIWTIKFINLFFTDRSSTWTDHVFTLITLVHITLIQFNTCKSQKKNKTK